jgi:hypothetical protein
MDAQARQALQTVYFYFDKYDLRTDAIAALGGVAKFLQDHPSFRVLAEGNCDERGSEQYNMGLGERRAKAVKKYLTSYGIGSDRDHLLWQRTAGKNRLRRRRCLQPGEPARRVEGPVEIMPAGSARRRLFRVEITGR